MRRLEGEPYIIQPKDFGIPKHPHVTQEEIDSVNRDLRRNGGIMDLRASDLLRRAEKAGQHLEADTFFPEDSVFARTQITRDSMGDAMQRRNSKPYNKVVPAPLLK